MKNIKLIMCVLGALAISSCSKYLDTNHNPNATTSSRPDLVLSSAELQIALGIGGRHAEQMNVWDQYWTGDQTVATGDWDKNNMTSSDAANPWNTLYRGTLTPLKYLIDKSAQPKYKGVAEILYAYTFQVLVDLYGDVPFTDAIKGADETPNRTPVVDLQTDIYPKLLAMIDDGMRLLDTVGSTIQEVQGDLIYDVNGVADYTQWKTFGNALKLKILMRQTNVSGTTVGTQIGDLYNNVLAANGDFVTTAKIDFTEDPGNLLNANPLWTELEGGALKNYWVGTTTNINYLVQTKDPRVDAFYDNPGGGPRGLDPGDQTNFVAPYSRPKGAKTGGDPYLYGPNVSFFLMTPWEINFLLAEAAARGFIAVSDEGYYRAAVRTNFEYFQVGGADALTDPTNLANGTALDSGLVYNQTSLDTKIKSIALQKWVSMIGTQPSESWIETRRLDNTSNPVFASPGGIFKDPAIDFLGAGIFPSLMYYSDIEVSLNPNVHQHTLTDKTFWDR